MGIRVPYFGEEFWQAQRCMNILNNQEVIELSSILLCKVECKVELDCLDNERLETDNSIPDYNINKEEFLKTRQGGTVMLK